MMETFSQRLCASGIHQFEDYDDQIYPGPRCSKCGKWALKREPFKKFHWFEILFYILITVGGFFLLVNAGIAIYFLF